MITTNTGAKKLESSDNWREIFPDNQGAQGAHNTSVGAHDAAISQMCQTISGTTNNCGHTINSGEFFIANGGKYKATASIPVNEAWSGSAQPVSDNDLINALNNSLTNQVPEFVSNTNGKAYKFPSGMLVCTKTITINAACTNSWGSLYESQQIDLGSWAVPFQNGRPCVSITNTGGQGGWFEYVTDTSSVLVGKTYLLRPNQNTADVYIDIIGVGRWK